MLSDYLDGEVPDRVRRDLESHLKGCQTCRRILRELRKVDEITRSEASEDPPEGYWESYWERLRKRL